MHRVFIGLGANLGLPEQQLVTAIMSLRAHKAIKVVAVSSLYRSAPLDVPDVQPDYLNAVVEIATTLSPHALKVLGQTLEKKAGSEKVKFRKARRLDIDWLLYDEDVVNELNLKIPHQELTKRAFVLVPLCDIAPDIRHPVLGATMAALKEAVTTAGVQQIRLGSDWASADKE